MASRAAAKQTGGVFRMLQKWYYERAGFNQIGLLRDDTLRETDDVKEAVKRLPEDVYNARAFRIKRALDLDMKKQILPKDQWTKFEEDVRYLQPYLDEVWKEKKEKQEWDSRY
ncbi:PREDICTED: cytochrome b-c1 complex subunit 7-like [Branchiostoma belcheri]|uniref:Cytochrome b-c1 complex subunit 7 n=1 Tax=Branchiostoma belcheri TaxID=7741 RepID=A0A6P5AM07_BRABE|nr:PREDICTED: cytochrome b-c1 complex subunit 7-like [Branchiostoma belcheri]KAI8503985.1 hypothetical protein Bbelb_180530 [Branchiostoma belcheri]